MDDPLPGATYADVLAILGVLSLSAALGLGVLYLLALRRLGRSLERNDPALWRELARRVPAGSPIGVAFALLRPHLGLRPPPPLSKPSLVEFEEARARFWVVCTLAALALLLAALLVAA
jgi:hypothetical protein